MKERGVAEANLCQRSPMWVQSAGVKQRDIVLAVLKKDPEWRSRARIQEFRKSHLRL